MCLDFDWQRLSCKGQLGGDVEEKGRGSNGRKTSVIGQGSTLRSPREQLRTKTVGKLK